MSGLDRLDRPTEWRLMTLAFGIWAVNFVLGYAAVLIQPAPFGKSVLVIAAVISVPAFALIWRFVSNREGAKMIRVSVLITFLATLFNALVVIA